MPGSDVPTLLLLAALCVLLVVFLPGAVRAWRTYAGVSRRRQEDATGRAPTPEGALAARLAEIERLGYRRLGETWVSTPLGGAFTWVLVASDGAAYALVGAGSDRTAGMTGFYSAWPDGEWLGTLHPFGRRHTRPGLRLEVERGTLAAAEAAHQARVRELRLGRGAPRRIRGLADVLALDADYRTRFGGRELRPRLIEALLPTAVIIVGIVVCLLDLLTRTRG